MDYKHSKHHVFLLHYHLIWCPKRRRPILAGAVKQRLLSIIKDVARERSVDILALEIMPEHLHLFVSSHPMLPVHQLVKAIKARSSRLLRKEFPALLEAPVTLDTLVLCFHGR